jgi:hypothetical protein
MIPPGLGRGRLGFLMIGLFTIFPSVVLFLFPESSKNNNNKIAAITSANSNGGVMEIGKVKRPLTKLALRDRHVQKSDPNARGRDKVKSKFISCSYSYVIHMVLAILGAYWAVLHSKVYVGTVLGRIVDVLAFKGYMGK